MYQIYYSKEMSILIKKRIHETPDWQKQEQYKLQKPILNSLRNKSRDINEKQTDTKTITYFLMNLKEWKEWVTSNT